MGAGVRTGLFVAPVLLKPLIVRPRFKASPLRFVPSLEPCLVSSTLRILRDFCCLPLGVCSLVLGVVNYIPKSKQPSASDTLIPWKPTIGSVDSPWLPLPSCSVRVQEGGVVVSAGAKSLSRGKTWEPAHR